MLEWCDASGGSAGWHRSLLLDNGFAVADVVWRRGNEAVMVAVTT